jgi:hypothetical protein
MYMREMGTVELLTREGELRIAKRIEEGLNQVLAALSIYPRAVEGLLGIFEQVEKTSGACPTSSPASPTRRRAAAPPVIATSASTNAAAPTTTTATTTKKRSSTPARPGRRRPSRASPARSLRRVRRPAQGARPR